MEFLQNKFVVRNKKIFLIRFAELFYSLTVIFFWIASLRSQWLLMRHTTNNLKNINNILNNIDINAIIMPDKEKI